MPRDTSVNSAPSRSSVCSSLFARQTPAQILETHAALADSGRRRKSAPQPLPPSSAATRVISKAERDRRRNGERHVWDPTLIREHLYEDGFLPPPLTGTTRPHQVCTLCSHVKCHPVVYACGHSHCSACIRLPLEHEWTCPDCDALITRPPCRHLGEEQGIAFDYPNWENNTSVYYTWDGLTWPRRPRREIGSDAAPDA
ncbi:hypothetical protein B0H19DRAFT_1374710 [Mycena capillaripes]|nr:hypothetical protein B0H19DRAFT_1374710 [Mycena capillaripes]